MMQALKKRPIAQGHQFDHLFPRSTRQDSVVRSAGKAKLHHTINLIKQMVPETQDDTRLLAKALKGKNLKDTCRNIWQFVYNHIQYSRDKAGVEQVRRPSRTWADRRKGVDCDCYTVFISSILANLKIPHKARITKYGGKPYFQHIYPIVPVEHGYITLDCVTDQFDNEVPFSYAKDFDMNDLAFVSEINGIKEISGVDSADLLTAGLGIYSLKQPRLPLRQVIFANSQEEKGITQQRLLIKPLTYQQGAAPQTGSNASHVQGKVEVRSALETNSPGAPVGQRIRIGMAGKLLLAFGVGLGAYKLTEILT